MFLSLEDVEINENRLEKKELVKPWCLCEKRNLQNHGVFAKKILFYVRYESSEVTRVSVLT